MRASTLLCALSGLLIGCSDDSLAGRGSGTLLVNADVDNDDGNGAASIRVRRGGADVTNAMVTLSSSAGDVLLVYDSDSHTYRGSQPGWRGGYSIAVRVGDDWLDGGVTSPEEPVLTRPAPGIAFDPHLADRGVVELAWSGSRSDTIRVRTKKYDPGFTTDQGSVLVSNTYFTELTQDVTLERENSTQLAGGAAGSSLAAHSSAAARLIVTNPF